MTTCTLCLSDEDLQLSHVFPEFLYEHLYDDKHRYNVLSVARNVRERIEQKGYRERLLCGSCESTLSKLERYASLVIKGGAPGIEGSREESIVSVKGVDYAKFKLFLLSLIWRAGVAQGRYFERVQLGPHQERLRAMLVSNDPGDFDVYACIFFGLNWEPNEIPGLMMQPSKTKIWGHTAYHVVLPGLKLVFFISNQRLGAPANKFVLQLDGTLKFQVRSPMELPDLHAFMKEFDQQGRRPRLEA